MLLDGAVDPSRNDAFVRMKMLCLFLLPYSLNGFIYKVKGNERLNLISVVKKMQGQTVKSHAKK